MEGVPAKILFPATFNAGFLVVVVATLCIHTVNDPINAWASF